MKSSTNRRISSQRRPKVEKEAAAAAAAAAMGTLYFVPILRRAANRHFPQLKGRRGLRERGSLSTRSKPKRSIYIIPCASTHKPAYLSGS